MASKGFGEAKQSQAEPGKGAICEWASVPPRIALVAKSWGVSAHQLVGGESPVDGRCNHGPESMFLVHPKCIPGQSKTLCTRGEDDLLLATCLTALDGLQDEPGGRRLGLGK
jgi:hypothetical protein